MQTISDGLTAPQEDDDSPGYSRLLNESILNENILNENFSQPGMSDFLSRENIRAEEQRGGEGYRGG